MLWHRHAKLGDGLATVGKKSRAERWIDPGLRYDTCPVLWNPLFLSEMVQLLDSRRRVHSTRVERGLNRFDPLLYGGGAMYDAIVSCHVSRIGNALIPRPLQICATSRFYCDESA